MITGTRTLAALLALVPATLAFGSEAIPNWPAPAVWTPPGARGLTTLSVTNPLPFIALTPCRLVDTRGTVGVPINTGGAFSANEIRTWTFTGVCGIPVGAAAVSLNITVTSTQSNPFGFVAVWPGGTTEPNVSTLNWSTGGVTESNAAIVPLGGGGTLSLQTGNAGAQVIVDTNGFYTQSSASASFEWDTAGSVGIVGNSTAGSGVDFGVIGQVASTTNGSAGVSGLSLGGVGTTYGVLGMTNGNSVNAAGVRGVDASGPPSTVSLNTAGVRGESKSHVGVIGLSTETGVMALGFDTTGSTILSEADLGSGLGVGYGVIGYSFGTAAGQPPVLSEGDLGVGLPGGYGVRGFSNVSTATDQAGVFGVDATGKAGGIGKLSAGVRGESATHFGVLGQGQVESISGELLTTSGAFIGAGVLGTSQAGHDYGVYSFGDFGGTGAKYFVEPHPTDASKVIRYVALEGPEAGTYFRGRARFSHGLARIEVPESFRLVTDEEGLTVQITPIGEMASYAVTQVGLNEIVVEGSKDVEFYYTVNGVRQTFKDLEVISSSREYMPRSPNDRMPEGFSPEQKRRLIANGTYNPDGTVNMQTAERVGWTRVWREWEERDRAAVAANAAARVGISAKRHGL